MADRMTFELHCPHSWRLLTPGADLPGGRMKKPTSNPPDREWVMVYDASYDGWTIGMWDEYQWITANRRDDCWVVAWCPLPTLPGPHAPQPPGVLYEDDREGWDEFVEAVVTHIERRGLEEASELLDRIAELERHLDAAMQGQGPQHCIECDGWVWPDACHCAHARIAALEAAGDALADRALKRRDAVIEARHWEEVRRG